MLVSALLSLLFLFPRTNRLWGTRMFSAAAAWRNVFAGLGVFAFAVCWFAGENVRSPFEFRTLCAFLFTQHSYFLLRFACAFVFVLVFWFWFSFASLCVSWSLVYQLLRFSSRPDLFVSSCFLISFLCCRWLTSCVCFIFSCSFF